MLSLPDLNTLRTEKLGGEVIPRSVLLAVFEDIPYLLCALGDGQLFNWQLDSATGELRDVKKICLGTKPIMLRTFRFLAAPAQQPLHGGLYGVKWPLVRCKIDGPQHIQGHCLSAGGTQIL